MSGSDSARIDRLEIRLTEQEAVIEDLNATLTEQWRVIDALKRQVMKLGEELEKAGSPDVPERPPPHY